MKRDVKLSSCILRWILLTLTAVLICALLLLNKALPVSTESYYTYKLFLSLINTAPLLLTEAVCIPLLIDIAEKKL